MNLVPGLPVFLDTETTGLNPRKDTLVLVILAQEGMAEPVVLDVRGKFTWVYDLNEVLAQSTLVAHNAKFDVAFLRANGVKVGKVFCTQIAEQVLAGVGLEDSRVQGINLSLAGLAETYNVRTKKVSKAEREWFYTELPKDLTQPIPEAQIAYAAEDVKLLFDIYGEQQAALKKQPHLAPVLDLEMRVLPALVDVEATGIQVDVPQWKAFIAEKQKQAKELEEDVLATFGEDIVRERIRQYDQDMAAFQEREAAEDEWLAGIKREYDDKPDVDELGNKKRPWGELKKGHVAAFRERRPRSARPKLDTAPPNIASSAQLLSAFEVQGIPYDTTDSKLLAPHADEYPAIKLLMAHRKAQKFVTSFGETLLAHVEEGSRIHPEYVQIGASTGRMSCTRPNWQQIPSRGDGKHLRECVVAAPGHMLLTADFSNIEMRILAEYSRDPRLLDFFDRDVDLHSEVARLMFGLGQDVNPKVTPCPAVPGWTYRDVAKTINYGLVYGMSATRLARTALIPKSEADRLMTAYFELFPGVVEWLSKAREVGFKYSRSRTMLGRHRIYRNLPKSPSAGATFEEHQNYRQAKARVERQSMNTPIQGTSADITKEALALVYESLPPSWGHVVAIVHDELVVEAKVEHVPASEAILEVCMDQAQHDICRLDRKQAVPRVALPMPEVHTNTRWEK